MEFRGLCARVCRSFQVVAMSYGSELSGHVSQDLLELCNLRVGGMWGGTLHAATEVAVQPQQKLSLLRSRRSAAVACSVSARSIFHRS